MVVLQAADLAAAALFSPAELHIPRRVITTGSDVEVDEDVFACVVGAVVLEVDFAVELVGFAVSARAIEHINKHTEIRNNITKELLQHVKRDYLKS